jgi:DNA-binding transcriptional LysR family regulator
VAALERETATRLIERGVRPVRLAGLRRGRLRIASFPTAIATLVPHAVARFNQRHPDVEMTVLDDHLQGLLPRLVRWELDLALVYDHEALPEPAVPLERTRLLDDPFDLIVRDRHRLARRGSVALADLAGETWIRRRRAGVAILPRLALAFMRPGLQRVALTEPPVRRIAAARLAASHRSAATASMLGVLRETAESFTVSPRRARGRRR